MTLCDIAPSRVPADFDWSSSLAPVSRKAVPDALIFTDRLLDGELGAFLVLLSDRAATRILGRPLAAYEPVRFIPEVLVEPFATTFDEPEVEGGLYVATVWNG